jgi:hypothetical protein
MEFTIQVMLLSGDVLARWGTLTGTPSPPHPGTHPHSCHCQIEQTHGRLRREQGSNALYPPGGDIQPPAERKNRTVDVQADYAVVKVIIINNVINNTY